MSVPSRYLNVSLTLDSYSLEERVRFFLFVLKIKPRGQFTIIL